MDLKATLSSLAVKRPHVLLVEIPGWRLTRMAAERELARRGWAQCSSPADADILLTCGVPGAKFGAVIDRVWDQLPGPRVRCSVTSPERVPRELDQSRSLLSDHASHVRDANTRQSSDPDSKTSHGDMEGDMDGDMDMPMPGGIALAEGGADRDGLDLDVLHLSLGPVLRYWPAGLVVNCSLQGDVITEATVDVLVGTSTVRESSATDPLVSVPPSNNDEVLRRTCARYCDDAANLLALMGWERMAVGTFTVRDRVLEGMQTGQAIAELNRITRSVTRSRILRWSLKDLPDVLERLQGLLGRAGAALESRLPPDEQRGLLNQIPEMITGRDLAAARLIIASLALETAAVVDEDANHA